MIGELGPSVPGTNKIIGLLLVVMTSSYSLTILPDVGELVSAQNNDNNSSLGGDSPFGHPQEEASVNYSRLVILLEPEVSSEVRGLTADKGRVTSNLQDDLASAEINSDLVSENQGVFVYEIEPSSPIVVPESTSLSLGSSGIDTRGMNSTEKQDLSTFLAAKEALERQPGVAAVSPQISYELPVTKEEGAVPQEAEPTSPQQQLPPPQGEEQAQTLPSGIDRIDADSSPIFAGDGHDDVKAVIAIVDTGVNEHQDLNVAVGSDRQRTFVTKSIPAGIPRDARDNCGHGTHVAGIAAAKDNNFGVVGVAPGAIIWNLKVIEQQPENTKKCTADNNDIVSALEFITANADKIDVVNLSLNQHCKVGDIKCDDPAFQTALSNVVAAGVVIVVSAGNHNPGWDATRYIPSRFEPAITVSSVTDTDGKCGGRGLNITQWDGIYNDDALALDSNFGPVVDIAAPGVEINSTSRDGGYEVQSGTSMAAPMVAGAAASYIAFNAEKNPTPSDVLAALISTASNSYTQCDGSNGSGYFSGDRDAFPEPLLYTGGLNESSLNQPQTGNSDISRMNNSLP